jgi:hypothetical protein
MGIRARLWSDTPVLGCVSYDTCYESGANLGTNVTHCVTIH